ncbi:TBC1 domain family member 19-like isoform X1 [Bolinopsis microptera]|uniref:TBC1 domain family member 19-like isoform X1 n=1 Tax=Bolinopsis microptera TaxID=2820187 RepID=UPI003079399B
MVAGTQSNDTVVKDIISVIQASDLGWTLKRAVQDELSKSFVNVKDIKRLVPVFMKESGWDIKVRNIVFMYLMTHIPAPHPITPPETLKEPMSFIRNAQARWEKRILKSINTMCTEKNIPLARMRTIREQADFTQKWKDMTFSDENMGDIRPVYAPKDFMEVLTSLSSPNYTAKIYDYSDVNERSGTSVWGLIQVRLHLNTTQQLRVLFSNLSTHHFQTGADDIEGPNPEWQRLGVKAVQLGYTPTAQRYLQQGCYPTQRGDIWLLALGVNLSPLSYQYYNQLRASVFKYELLVDRLFLQDVRLTAGNHEAYFVFEDLVVQILLCFSRDTQFLDHFKSTSASPPHAYTRNNMGETDQTVVYPPNGIIPFHGFSLFIAPMCFIWSDPVILYNVFKALYTRFFFRLHSLSSHPQGILSLCQQFETMLQTHQPQLFYHLREMGSHPLKHAFNWIMHAFAGYLETSQLLLLWDRVIGYGTLEILPVLAVAVFAFRRNNLMEVTTPSEAEAVLQDVSSLKVIPLLQYCLYARILHPV